MQRACRLRRPSSRDVRASAHLLSRRTTTPSRCRGPRTALRVALRRSCGLRWETSWPCERLPPKEKRSRAGATNLLPPDCDLKHVGIRSEVASLIFYRPERNCFDFRRLRENDSFKGSWPNSNFQRLKHSSIFISGRASCHRSSLGAGAPEPLVCARTTAALSPTDPQTRVSFKIRDANLGPPIG